MAPYIKYKKLPIKNVKKKITNHLPIEKLWVIINNKYKYKKSCNNKKNQNKKTLHTIYKNHKKRDDHNHNLYI